MENGWMDKTSGFGNIGRHSGVVVSTAYVEVAYFSNACLGFLQAL